MQEQVIACTWRNMRNRIWNNHWTILVRITWTLDALVGAERVHITVRVCMRLSAATFSDYSPARTSGLWVLDRLMREKSSLVSACARSQGIRDANPIYS